MMVLQVVSEDKALLQVIANDLLKAKLIANAVISDQIIFKTLGADNQIHDSVRYTLKGISKSLLFSKINTRLRQKHNNNMPLLYAEPIIMIDTDQTEEILSKLTPV